MCRAKVDERPMSSGGRWFVCSACGYIYDPDEGDQESGIAPGTSFEALPDDWTCPVCEVGKSAFVPYED